MPQYLQQKQEKISNQLITQVQWLDVEHGEKGEMEGQVVRLLQRQPVEPETGCGDPGGLQCRCEQQDQSEQARVEQEKATNLGGWWSPQKGLVQRLPSSC